jgi:dolichyl-phosphate beta-glucosyltransferase
MVINEMTVSTAPTLSLILPAYNEAAAIRSTIEAARAYFDSRRISGEIIVAADGDDGTRELVAEMARHDARPDSPLIVIGESRRRGKGRGIREGVALARGRLIGFADADHKTPIEEYDHFAPLLAAGYEVVIGSRRLDASRIERAQPLHRRLGSRGFNLLMRGVTGLGGIRDTQCGFKFFSRAAALDLFSRARIDGYMLDVEILVLARQSGYRIAQVPVRWRDDGDSRLALVSGNLRNAIDLLRILGTSRLRPSWLAGEAREGRES